MKLNSNELQSSGNYISTLDSVLPKDCRILINGATGWLGSNISETLVKIFGLNFKENLLLSGSRDSTLHFQNGIQIQVNEWSKRLVEEFCPTHVIQLAFKTRDHVNAMSINNYLEINEKIISNALWMTSLPSLKGFLHTSSGAALGKNADDKHLDPYGYLKKLEESIYSEACMKQGVNYFGLRVWSTTGRYIKTGGLFAIESFISQALSTKTIQIESPGDVVRSYADANEIMVGGMLGLFTDRNGVFNSGGTEVEIGDLAKFIAEFSFNKRIQIVRSERKTGVADLYVSLEPSVEQILKSHDLTYSNLPKQVITTTKYLMWREEAERLASNTAK